MNLEVVKICALTRILLVTIVKFQILQVAPTLDAGPYFRFLLRKQIDLNHAIARVGVYFSLVNVNP